MENVKLCQSCASPLTKPKDFGTEADGSKSSDYCCPCYENGSLYGGEDMKMEEMIEICVPYAVKAGKYKDANEARAAMREFFPKLVLPLLHETARSDDEASFEIASGDQLLDQKAGHDRFACTGIVSEKKPQRLPGEHLTINGGNLVRERIDKACVDCQIGIEIMSQLDPIRFRNEAQEGAIGIE